MRRRRSSQPRLASELIDSWPFSRAAPGRFGPVVVDALAFPVAFSHSYPDRRTVPLAGGSCRRNSCFFLSPFPQAA